MRRIFNHVSEAKLTAIIKARDDALDKANERNDERILTLMRKHLKQFNLQNHTIEVSYGFLNVRRKGVLKHAFYYNEVDTRRQSLNEQIDLILDAASDLQAHYMQVSQVV